MLRNFLPFLHQKDPNAPQSSSVNDMPISHNGLGSSLFYQQENSETIYFSLGRLASLFKKLSYLILWSFLLLLIYNFYLDLKLKSSYKMLDSFSSQAEYYSLVRAKAMSLNKKIDFYNQTLSRRVSVGEKNKVLFSNVSSTSSVKNALVTSDKFTLSIEVLSPYDFGVLINKYLDSGHIAEISLKSAELSPKTNIYEVTLQGKFK